MTESTALSIPMLVSAVILVFTFVGIFTEELHGFHRSKFAVLGALLMIVLGQIFGFYSPEIALELIDWNVIFLLFCMMTFIAILAPTGGFQNIAYHLLRISGGRKFLLLALLATTTAVLSMFLDNVTTVVIFGPLAVLMCQLIGVSPIPFMLGISMLAVSGGIATIIGDPTSIMIGSANGASFVGYAAKMLPIVILASATMLAVLWLMYRKELAGRAQLSAQDLGEDRGKIKDPFTWYLGVGLLVLMIALFVMHGALHWEAWFVAAVGFALLSFFARKADMTKTFEEVEITLIVFLVSLFIVIGGVEHSGFLSWVADQISPVFQNNPLVAALAILWISAILSAAIDNIPFVAAMIPVIAGLESKGVQTEPLWWALAMGAGLGGLGSHVGSAVNVFMVSLSERVARQSGDHSMAITPGLWFRRATPAAFAGLLVATVFFVIFFQYYSGPIN